MSWISDFIITYPTTFYIKKITLEIQLVIKNIKGNLARRVWYG